MFDKDLVISILTQIDEALPKVLTRAARIRSADDFTDSLSGMETFDSIYMLFMLLGSCVILKRKGRP